MFSRFFIDRPIFAAVVSIVITLAGGIAVYTLPIAQYPPVTPPTVQVDCNYPGASALVVSQTVGAPIEQKVNGVEDMLYMSSQSTNDGSYSLTVTFKPGIDLNLAQVLVQNRVNLALPSLPEAVRQTGVTTKKRSPDILLTVSLNSPDGRYDQLYLSNYALLHLVEELSRLPGISEVRVFGQRDYSMRVWLDPDKLAMRGLVVADVMNAIREQNAQVALGQIGQPPAPSGQAKQIPLSILGRLSEAGEFEKIVVRAMPDGRLLRIGDVGRVEINARSQDIGNRFDGKPTVGLAVFQLPDANALDTADRIKAAMQELSKDFPDGVEHAIGYDTTPFIRESIEEVFNTLRDAVLLVALVVLIFLQGWRPAVIPLIAVPVAIVGTFAAMALAGFSLNNLTLFGLVLAIGIVVDDAIVVVEAVEQFIERGFDPRAAAFKAMDEVSGPIIAVGFVLTAVFVPCAFISGIVGQFYRQFALTIAISTIISTFNSLTLSPALAVLLLKPRGNHHQQREALPRVSFVLLGGWLGYEYLGTWLEGTLAERFPAIHVPGFHVWHLVGGFIGAVAMWFASRAANWVLNAFFSLFNFVFNRLTSGYVTLVGVLLRGSILVFVAYLGLLVLTYWGFSQLPTGFIPTQDKGYLVASVQLPDSASNERTQRAIAQLEQIAMGTPGVKNVNSVVGNSFLLGAYGSNFGSMFIILDEFKDRRDPELSADKIMATVRKRSAAEVPEAVINVFPPPAVSGLGRAGGFRVMIEDRGDLGLKYLQEQTDNLIKKGNDSSSLAGLFTVYKASSPQLFVDVNREACLSQGVNLDDVFGTLQAYLGSRYVNDFNRFGRTWQVVVQADSAFRDDIDDVRKLMVRNQQGKMIPLGSLCEVRSIGGPLVLTRYNMYPAASINGNVKPGVSSGDGIRQFEEIARAELPQSMAYEWTEITYLERLAGNTGMIVFFFSVVFVFLVLAALYESWALPLAVILVVPMCVLGSIAGVAMAKMDINIFTQIGFVVLIGLACKNAILIVEFAKFRREAGESTFDATLQACQLRLRPIIMTSLAFILGVIPLVIATGAGFEMRRALGTAVFSGMIGVTFFGILLTPVFYYSIDRLSHWHLLENRWLRRASALSLDILRLGPVRRPLVSGFKWMTARAKRKSTAKIAPQGNQCLPPPPINAPPAAIPIAVVSESVVEDVNSHPPSNDIPSNLHPVIPTLSDDSPLTPAEPTSAGT